MRHAKRLEEYEQEAKRVGECLIHGTHSIARKIYQLRHGKLLTREYVCHTCDTPLCIEDSHHFIGTPSDNTRDAVKKNRHSSCRVGEQSPRHILTEEAVKEIRESSAPGTVLALKYGVHFSTISKIRRGKNWRNNESTDG